MAQTDREVYHILLLEESILLKITILLKAIYRFSPISIESLMAFFTELEQKYLQFVWKSERPQVAKVILRRKKKKELEK